MYTCGLTVNHLMHIGHARTYIFWDIVERFLHYLGYEVMHVSNITDISVDDRILKRVKETGETFQQLVTRHTLDYILDRRRLGIGDPLTYTLATQHIDKMIELVQRLLENGFAYVAEDGVYFRISKFPNYGKLAGIDPKKLQEGASGRIDKDEYDKEAVGDFVLWKQATPEEPYWFSPWGRGRPGWHIECSAMSMTYLGETIDISGGGEDNIFPHHENSIAQSEAATGKPYVRFWLHVRHLMLKGEKMSKSTGNFLLVRDALTQFNPASIRLFLLSTHYRKPINFTTSNLARSQKRLEQLQKVITKLLAIQVNPTNSETPNKPIIAAIEEIEYKFKAALLDDFNTSLAINTLFQFVNQITQELDSSLPVNPQTIMVLLDFFDRVGKIIFGDLYEEEVRTAPDPFASALIEHLLEERKELRRSKKYKQADNLRAFLQKLGVEVFDTAQGTQWWRKPQSSKSKK